MNKLLLYCSFISIYFGNFKNDCCINLKVREVTEYKIKRENDTLPNLDWSIQKGFELGSKKGLKKYMSINKYNQIKNKYYSEASFLNKQHSEYCDLKLYFFGEIQTRAIEIGYYKKKNRNTIMLKTGLGAFCTNRLIKLGITELDFLNLTKGIVYDISFDNQFKTYQYSTILKKAADFSYINNKYQSVYYFKNNKLVKFIFEFE